MIESIFFNPWVWIVPVIIAVILALVALGIFLVRADDLSLSGTFLIVFGGIIAVVITPIYFGFMLPPYDTSYYQTYRIAGQIEQVDSAFSGDEGTMSQTFIAKVEGIDLYIRSDDQRFRTLEVGDDVNLVCGKGFAYFQESWYSCDFGGVS